MFGMNNYHNLSSVGTFTSSLSPYNSNSYDTNFSNQLQYGNNVQNQSENITRPRKASDIAGKHMYGWSFNILVNFYSFHLLIQISFDSILFVRNRIEIKHLSIQNH